MPTRDHPPQRTCLGCRRRDDKSRLVRHVLRTEDGRALIERDDEQVRPGRGGYLHDAPECVDAALRRNAFRRAFRIPAGIAAELVPVTDHRQAGTSM